MNNLIHNVSIIFLIMGIMLMVHYVSRIDHKCKPSTKLKYIPREYDLNQDLMPRPSKTFNKMFESPTVWMGYDNAESKSFTQINKGKYTPGKFNNEDTETETQSEILRKLDEYNKLTKGLKEKRDRFIK